MNLLDNTVSEVTAYWQEIRTEGTTRYRYAVIDAQGQSVTPTPGWEIQEHPTTGHWQLIRVDSDQLSQAFPGLYLSVEDAQAHALALTYQMHPPVGRWEKVLGIAHWYRIVYRSANDLPVDKPSSLLARPVDKENPEGDWEFLTLSETGNLTVATLKWEVWELLRHNLFPYTHPE